MLPNSRSIYTEDEMSNVLDVIGRDLKLIVGDIAGEVRFPSDADGLVDTLSLLGRSCLIAHAVSNREQAPSGPILERLHNVAQVMGQFERGMKTNHIEDVGDALLEMLESAATEIDAYIGDFGENLRFNALEKTSETGLMQALESRQRVDHCRVALLEMGLSDAIVELMARLRRFDDYYKSLVEPLHVGLHPVPGLPIDSGEWWVITEKH
jgi:hypothetical protein